jgi:peroxiredoxin
MSEPLPLAPNFQLAGTAGELETLSSFRGKENVYLVFNRGLSCSFCRAHMRQLRQDADAFSARHTAILVISPDRPDALKEYWKAEVLPFAGLSDPDHQAAALYGQHADLYRNGRLPLQVIVGWDGRIRYRHASTLPADIPPNQEILNILDRINQEPPT